MKKILFLFIVAITLQATAQESVLLRYNYKKGDVYEIKMTMKQEVGAFMAQTTKLLMTQTTISTEDKVFINEGKIANISLDMLQGGNSINYDSSKKEEELDDTGKMMKQQMDPVLSSTIQTKTNDLGDVLDITITPDNPQTAQMSQQNSSVVYPKEAVSVGSEWTSTDEEGGMTIKLTYKVAKITPTTVVLDLSGEVSGLAKGTATGSMIVDRESGVPSTSKIEMKMETQGQELLIVTEGSYTKK